MGNAQSLLTMNREAGEDLSSAQYLFVTGATDGQVEIAGAADVLLGILQDNNASSAGDPCLVAIGGVSKLVVDGNAAAIAVGDPLAADSAGKGVKTTTDKDDYGAIALEASTAAGDIISVLVTPGQLVSAS